MLDSGLLPDEARTSRRSVLGFFLGLLASPVFVSAAPARLLASEWGENEQLVLHQGWVLRAGDVSRLARS
jgi:hypothetical protein